MLAACFGRPCGPWRARPRLPWPPLGGLPRRALCPAGKANMAALAKNCKPFFDIFSNFLFLPYISGVYKRPEPRQQGGKRPQARPIGRAQALARGQQGEQGRGPIRHGQACACLGALARAYARALARVCACLPARMGARPCACPPMRAHARPCARLPAHVPARARACARGLALSRKRSRKGEECARQAEGRGRGPGGRFSTIYKCLRRTKQLFKMYLNMPSPRRAKIFQNQNVSPCYFLQYMLCKMEGGSYDRLR